VTIVKGTQPWHGAAAERLTKIFEPWGVRCATVDAAAVNKPRALSEKEIPTWVGLTFGRVDLAQPPNVGINGFALDGPALLLGTPETIR